MVRTPGYLSQKAKTSKGQNWKGWTINLRFEDLPQRVHDSALSLTWGSGVKSWRVLIFSQRWGFGYRGCSQRIWSSLVLFRCIDMEGSEYLSYNGRTQFSKESATYIPIGGRSIFCLLFSYIIIICFLKRFMSVVCRRLSVLY